MASTEQLAGALCEAFVGMSSTDPAVSGAATKCVEELTSAPLALGALLGIISNNPEATLRFRAVLCIKASKRGGWNELPIETKCEYIHALTQFLTREPEKLIRFNMCHAISELIGKEGCPSYQEALKFARWAAETNDQGHIHVAIKLMTELLGAHPKLTEQPEQFMQFTAFCNALAQAGLKFGDPEMIVDCLQFAFEFNGSYVDMWSEEAAKFVEYAVSQFGNFHTAGGPIFCEFVSLIGEIFDKRYTFAQGLEGPVLGCIGPAFLADERAEEVNSMGAVIVDLCDSDPEVAWTSGAVTPIVQKFIKLDLENCELDERLELLNCDSMEDICMIFAKRPEFTTAVWGLCQELWGNPQGKCVALLTAIYCSEEYPEFFDDKIDNLVQMIGEMLSSGHPLPTDIGIKALKRFVKTFNYVLPDYVDQLEELILNVFKSAPSEDLMYGFVEVLAASSDTDNIFEEVMPILLELIQKAAQEYGITALQLLDVLVKNSHVQVMTVYDDLLRILRQLVEASMAGAPMLLEGCVETLASLATKSPERFAPAASWFTEAIMNFIQIDDNGLKSACLNAYGKMIRYFAQPMAQTAMPMAEVAYQLAGCDMSSEVERLALTAEMHGAMDEDVGIDSLPTNDLQMAGGALLLLIQVIDTYPPLVPQLAGMIMERINLLRQSRLPWSVEAALIAGAEIVNCMVKAGCPNGEIISALIAMVLDMVEDGEVGMYVGAMEILSRIIENFGIAPFGDNLPMIIGLVQDSFDGELNCMVDIGVCPEEAHKVMISVATGIMKAAPDQVNVILGKVMERVVVLAQHELLSQKMLALAVMRSYIEHSQVVAPEIPPLVIQIASQLCTDPENGDVGFSTFKRFAAAAPQLIAPFVEQIVAIIDSKLMTNKRNMTQQEQSTMDACMGCLSVIVTNIVKDAFPVANWIGKMLKWMPAKHDMDENADIMNLYMWLLNKPECLQQCGHEMLGVLVRLFTSGMDPADHGLSGEAFMALRSVFTKLVQMVPDGQAFCASQCRNKSKAALLQQAIVTGE